MPNPSIDGMAPEKAGDIDPATGKKVLYWHDPMAPGQKFDKPGKSPFMDMALVPESVRRSIRISLERIWKRL